MRGGNILILATSSGIYTSAQALKLRIGGEILFELYY